MDEIKEKSLQNQAGFKHVEKNAPKKEEPAKPLEKKALAPAAKVEVKKEPKKEFKYNTWYIVSFRVNMLRKTMEKKSLSMKVMMYSLITVGLLSNAKTRRLLLRVNAKQ